MNATNAPESHEHKSHALKYTVICIILVVLTAIEYFIFKIDSVRDNAMIMYPVLGTLSVIKLVLVVASYMHLADEPSSLKRMFLINSAFCVFILGILFFVALPLITS